MKTGLRGLKKTVTSQEISIFGTKEENPRCFCFASNHTESGWEHNSPSLLCCWFGIFLWCSVYLNLYAIESFAVSSVREECYLGDFFLTLTENNQYLHISLARWLTFILLFSIHRTRCLLYMFLRPNKQNQRRRFFFFPLALFSFAFLLPQKKQKESERTVCQHQLAVMVPFCNYLLFYFCLLTVCYMEGFQALRKGRVEAENRWAIKGCSGDGTTGLKV